MNLHIGKCTCISAGVCTRYFIHCLCITNLISLIDISSSSKQHLHYIEVSIETCCPQRTLSLKWKHSHIICMYNKHTTYIRCCYFHISPCCQQALYYIMVTISTCPIQWSCINLTRSDKTNKNAQCTYFPHSHAHTTVNIL